MSAPSSITVLMDNCVAAAGLQAEHGLALWIEHGAQRLLFDTGPSALLIANARRLQRDLTTVAAIILSHGHYDHGGGLAEVLAVAGDPAIYAHPQAWLPKYRRISGAPSRAIGIPPSCCAAAQQRRRHNISTPTAIAPGIFLTGEIPRSHPQEQAEKDFCLDEHGRCQDHFKDDQALYIPTRRGTLVVLGCAHAGLINTLSYIHRLTEAAPFYAVIGGMHLHAATPERIAWTVQALRQFTIERLCPLHCTGIKATAALWNAFPEHCLPGGVGCTLKFIP